jgi:hypothetical protein
MNTIQTPEELTNASNWAIVIPYVVVIDAQVIDEVTTTQLLQLVTVNGAGVDPTGGGTRYPATRGIARQAETRYEISMSAVG